MTLIPDPYPIPALMATTDDADALLSQLLDRGWVLFGEPLPTASAAGRLVVGSDRLQLVVNDQVLLDDLNPYAPDGWWAAVDARQGRCVVVIVRDRDVDHLTHLDAVQQLATLLGSRRAVFAALPVEPLLQD